MPARVKTARHVTDELLSGAMLQRQYRYWVARPTHCKHAKAQLTASAVSLVICQTCVPRTITSGASDCCKGVNISCAGVGTYDCLSDRKI